MHGLPWLSRSRGPLETGVGVLPKVALSVVFLAPKYDKNYGNSMGAIKTKITNLDHFFSCNILGLLDAAMRLSEC
jgi:hypothetical protein